MPKSSSRPIARARRRVLDWFAEQDWQPFRFQRQVWNAYLDGESGLVHATTGTGKTLAAWMGPLVEFLAEHPDPEESLPRYRGKVVPPPLTVLWITPLKALAGDTIGSLQRPLDGLGIPWRLEGRTGDTSSSTRARQRKKLPTALVTTPESLTLFLARPDGREQFANLKLVVVDEWHELLASKRGTQTELALARLRRWQPELRVWGLSATLGNIGEALHSLVGTGDGESDDADGDDADGDDADHDWDGDRYGDAHIPAGTPGDTLRLVDAETATASVAAAARPTRPKTRLVTGGGRKRYRVEALIPDDIERFPWAGHMGLRQVGDVAREIDSAASSLAFTNTRFQSEMWYSNLLKERSDWAGLIALHHGSLDSDTRKWVETGLKQGTLKSVVCTSSLDLGVDFAPVEKVFQIGSPKGIGRVIQRAGRSGHQPGQVSRLHCVPTHAFELVEIAALRDAMMAGQLEARRPISKPIDVLIQHLVTIACGPGFDPDTMLAEVRTTKAYAGLTEAEFDWALDFVVRGGEALRAYPEYRRVERKDDGDGLFRIANKKLGQLHRMNIGTITSDSVMNLQYAGGHRVGSVEEGFASRLRPGDCFRFGGRVLEFVRIHEMKVIVKKAPKGKEGFHPRWRGSRMPLSTELADAVLDRLEQARDGIYEGAEMEAVRPVLELQKRWSDLPVKGELLIESMKSREGHHLFFFPFAGRLVHEGLAAIVALRLSRLRQITFSMSIGDYGFELVSPDPAPLPEGLQQRLFSPKNLAADMVESINAAEMAKRQFREVARVAGLVQQGMPGAQRSVRQLQASTGLLFDVFRNYDPGNLLLKQSQEEVMEYQLESNRLSSVMDRLDRTRIRINRPERFTPMSFPLMVARLREKLSSEKLSDRIKSLQLQLETAADRG